MRNRSPPSAVRTEPNVTCSTCRASKSSSSPASSPSLTESADGTFETKTLFKTNKVNNHVHRPLLIDGHLYARGNTNERNDGLLCMDLDGNLKWKTERKPNFSKGNAILVDGLMYIIDGRTGFLHLVKPDPTGYKEISKVKVLNGPLAWAPMALSGNLLVIRDQSQMKCLDVGAK